MVVDDAGTSDYFSDDKEGLTFSLSKQVLDKNMGSPSDPEYEIEKKVHATEDNVDQHIAT